MDYLQVANHPLMWIAASSAVIVVVLQALIFLKKSLVAAKELGIEDNKVKSAIKSSIFSSIGPSIVILVGMISLLVSLGGPISWMRLSFIGSVSYELSGAAFGAQAMGAELGPTMGAEVYSNCIWTMVLGSLGWLIFTFLFADKMDKVNNMLSKGDPKFIPLISSCAILGAFAYLGVGYFFNPTGGLDITSKNAIACFSGGAIMMILSKIAQKKNIQWIKEWALSISMFSGMLIGTLINL